jgi:hypothetical protein
MKNFKFRTYLIGSIEDDKTSLAGTGTTWRDKLTLELQRLRGEVFDPCKLEKEKLAGLHILRLPESVTSYITGEQIKVTHWHNLKNALEPHFKARFKSYMRKIIAYDLGLVRKSDFVIVFWDRWSAGSSGEITVAYDEGIPIYIVSAQELPAWHVGAASKIFLNFEDLIKFLEREYGE